MLHELRIQSLQQRALIMTGHAVKDDLVELIDEVFHGVLHKPFDLSELKDTIRRALDAA